MYLARKMKTIAKQVVYKHYAGAYGWREPMIMHVSLL